MRHPRESLLPFLFLFLYACEDGGGVRMAGTSTTVGTSIGGTALLSDGRPAAGARVTARAEWVAFRDRKGNVRPESVLLDSATADSRGLFSLPSLHDRDFFLEIECDPHHACAAVDSAEVFLREYRNVSKGSLDTLRTAAPGSLMGSLVDSVFDAEEESESLAWIGIAGTARFVKPEAGVNPAHPERKSFRLDGLYPGDYILTVVAPSDSSGARISPKASVHTVKSGSLTDVGEIR